MLHLAALFLFLHSALRWVPILNVVSTIGLVLWVGLDGKSRILVYFLNLIWSRSRSDRFPTSICSVPSSLAPSAWFFLHLEVSLVLWTDSSFLKFQFRRLLLPQLLDILAHFFPPWPRLPVRFFLSLTHSCLFSLLSLWPAAFAPYQNSRFCLAVHTSDKFANFWQPVSVSSTAEARHRGILKGSELPQPTIIGDVNFISLYRRLFDCSLACGCRNFRIWTREIYKRRRSMISSEMDCSGVRPGGYLSPWFGKPWMS